MRGTLTARDTARGRQSFEKALPAVWEFESPRAWAFAIIGLHEYLRTLSGDLMANQFRFELARRLRAAYDKTAHYDWLWFEDVVSYDNARLPPGLDHDRTLGRAA